ncbi:MAG: CBS domain-containing protein [Archangiaceae bacterium]|nr:CBS domain-containing protein [Archangiaceae bacterium]
MKVEQMMTRDVKTCSESETLVKAVQLMWEHDIGAVPVVDDAGKVVGMITDRDCVMAAYTQGKCLHEVQVRSAMSSQVQTCQSSDSIENVTASMKRAQVRRLPVLDKKNKLVGMVSLCDLSRAAANEPNQRQREQYMQQVELTLAAVAKPRTTLRA